MPQSETPPPSSQYPSGKSPRQWKLSTVFLLVTLCAVAASGYSRGGTRGLWHSLFSIWFVVLGFCLILFGAKSRTGEDYFFARRWFRHVRRWVVRIDDLSMLVEQKNYKVGLFRRVGAMLHGFEGKSIYGVLACLRVRWVIGNIP